MNWAYSDAYLCQIMWNQISGGLKKNIWVRTFELDFFERRHMPQHFRNMWSFAPLQTYILVDNIFRTCRWKRFKFSGGRIYQFFILTIQYPRKTVRIFPQHQLTSTTLNIDNINRIKLTEHGYWILLHYHTTIDIKHWIPYSHLEQLIILRKKTNQPSLL